MSSYKEYNCFNFVAHSVTGDDPLCPSAAHTFTLRVTSLIHTNQLRRCTGVHACAQLQSGCFAPDLQRQQHWAGHNNLQGAAQLLQLLVQMQL